jgi:ERCC4-type nuclease
LLRKFHSLKRIREADENELAAIIGASKAKILKEKLADSTELS